MTGIIRHPKVQKAINHPKVRKVVNKKTILWFGLIKLVIYIFTASFFAIHAMNAEAAYGLPDSYTQVKTADSNTVYYLNHATGQKKAYTSSSAFFSYGNEFNQVKTISRDKLSLWADVKLIKTADSKNIYYIQGKTKSALNNSDLAVFANEQITDVNVSDFLSYKTVKRSEANIYPNSKTKVNTSAVASQYSISPINDRSVATETATSSDSHSKKAALRPSKLSNANDSLFRWPTSSHRISYYFHDANYPFRNYGEHDAIDIITSQGSSVYAAADGKVIDVADNNNGNFNYITVLHSNGITTRYGHVSKINVALGDEVIAGQKIALSGGKPGTIGAGPYTTGAHLDFQVTKDGAAVDPLPFME